MQDLLLDCLQFRQDLSRLAVPGLLSTHGMASDEFSQEIVIHNPRKELPIYFLGFLITWQFHMQI